MPWTTHPKVVELRQRSAPVDVVVETLDGFRRHLTGRNAAVLAYYGVLTLFPLLMAATTILGFVLQDRPDLQEDIVDSAISQIPVIGDQIQANSGRISGSWWALIIGLAIAVWGSLKAFVGLQLALDDTWEIAVDDRASGAIQRARALIGVLVIGLAQVGAVTLAAVVGQAGLPRTGQILITLGGFALNVVVVATMYRFLTSKSVTWAMVWPGAVFTGALYTVLQFVGANVMANTLDNAEDVYGTFAGILALMSWLSLHALISLVGAELNAALHRLGDRGAARPLATTS
ncbi:MAG: YihY/virulence factor BrkB family protein [Ilumatobacter sp.]|uniref:YihY/virulence factor BrkB family protein n=1 Tax=Ilumatobacter sp. TaxID=1967498 RepID=UPI002609B1DB|nr:YihY/virulence factor BrkB family protein [Ilumatobacter sp.]MDJ0769770.1 YihY/virulence factor BrkB family protein [Ilumatobacter sp.]